MSVKTSFLPSGANLAAAFPDSHLYSEKPGGNATKTARDPSTASSAARIASSRTSSADATDMSTSCTSSSSTTSSPPSSAEPSSSLTPPLALVPPWSLTRIPARLRRKCPLFAEQEEYDEGTAEKAGATESTSEEEGGAIPVPTSPAAGSVVTSPTASRSVRRARVPLPVPVPHLNKKSRGRRVPEPAEARERAHVCAVPGCSKSFARAEHLKRHVLSLHTHEKRTSFPVVTMALDQSRGN